MYLRAWACACACKYLHAFVCVCHGRNPWLIFHAGIFKWTFPRLFYFRVDLPIDYHFFNRPVRILYCPNKTYEFFLGCYNKSHVADVYGFPYFLAINWTAPLILQNHVHDVFSIYVKIKGERINFCRAPALN